MTRLIARLGPLWRALFLVPVLIVVLDVAGVADPPGGVFWVLGVIAVWVLLMVAMNLGPRADAQEPVEVLPPVRGRWLAMNSPGQGLPSHGVRKLGQLSAVDIVHPLDRRGLDRHEETAGRYVDPAQMRRALLGHRPERFSCFGEPVLAVAGGVVVAAADRQRDQRARNSWPALLWFSTAENVLRSIGGAWAIIGNRVVIRHDDGVYAAYAHLKQGSVSVREGQRVEAGQVIAEVGNTGNTTQPHLHFQLMDRAGFEEAAGIPMVWRDIQLEGVDPAWERYAKDPAPTALTAMPRNGEVFSA